MSNEIVSLISSIIGGLLVAIVNYVFARKKNEAEIEKLRAESEKIKAEAEKARAETTKLVSEIKKLSASVEEAASYRDFDLKEQVIYGSSRGIDIFDFEGEGSYLASDKNNKELGIGSIAVKESILTIQRDNSVGGYSINLRRYIYNNKQEEFIPKNEILSGKRKIRLSCEVKPVSGTCSIEVALKDYKTGEYLEYKSFEITHNDWTQINCLFRVSPTVDCYLNFFHYNIPHPNNLLLRNLILAER